MIIALSDFLKHLSSISPRLGAVVAKCPIADEQAVNEAVQQASEAQLEWGNLTPLQRGKIMKKAADIMRVSA